MVSRVFSRDTARYAARFLEHVSARHALPRPIPSRSTAVASSRPSSRTRARREKSPSMSCRREGPSGTAASSATTTPPGSSSGPLPRRPQRRRRQRPRRLPPFLQQRPSRPMARHRHRRWDTLRARLPDPAVSHVLSLHKSLTSNGIATIIRRMLESFFFKLDRALRWAIARSLVGVQPR